MTAESQPHQFNALNPLNGRLTIKEEKILPILKCLIIFTKYISTWVKQKWACYHLNISLH